MENTNSIVEKGCEALGGGCFWAEFWDSYQFLFDVLRDDAFRNLAIVTAALITWHFAHRRSKIADEDKKTAQKQARTSEAGLNIDRFQRGVTMLGDERLAIRQAGIIMLGELASQNMIEYFDQVQKVLCALIRDISEVQNTSEFIGLRKYVSPPTFEANSPPEIIAILTELSNLCELRAEYEELTKIELDLSNSNLTKPLPTQGR